jgi:CelD/BcsL family acetyltransferase involved in cellulose biosynthesis
VNIQIIKSESEFSALKTEWNTVLSNSQANTVFLTWEWLSSWWGAYAKPGDELYVITARDAGQKLIAILPFMRRIEGPLRVKTLRLIGDGSMDSDYLDFIIANGEEQTVLSEVWKFLRSQSRTWDVIEMAGIPESSRNLQWLNTLRQRERLVVRNDVLSCAISNLPESWDEYVATLKPRFRTKVRSTLRNIEQGNFRFYSVRTQEQLFAGLDTLFDLHARRWNMKGKSGVFHFTGKQEFYKRFTMQFLQLGWLAFDFLEIDGKVAACQMCFRYGGTQFLLQEGFDPDFSTDSVGIALRAMVFRKAIADGIRSYDFLAGVGRHKTQWNAEVKNCSNIKFGLMTVKNRIHLQLPVVLETGKEQLKRILPTKVLEIRRRVLSGQSVSN